MIDTLKATGAILFALLIITLALAGAALPVFAIYYLVTH